MEAEKNAHKKDVEAFEKYRAEMEDRLAKENELHAKDMEEREKLLDALEAEKHERSDLEIQLRAAREMQKQSNTELRNAAEKKEKALQKKIADLGQTRLDLKKQLQQALKEIEAERIASDEAVAAEKKRQGQLLKQYEKSIRSMK